MRKKNIVLSCICIFGIVLTGFIALNWKYMHRYNYDIDLNSGLCRERYYFWIFPIKRKPHETDLSTYKTYM